MAVLCLFLVLPGARFWRLNFSCLEKCAACAGRLPTALHLSLLTKAGLALPDDTFRILSSLHILFGIEMNSSSSSSPSSSSSSSLSNSWSSSSSDCRFGSGYYNSNARNRGYSPDYRSQRGYGQPLTAEQAEQVVRDFELVNAPFAAFVGLQPAGRHPSVMMLGAQLPRPGDARVPTIPAHSPASLSQGQPPVQYEPYVYPPSLATPSITVPAPATATAATCSSTAAIVATSACSVITVLGVAAYFLA